MNSFNNITTNTNFSNNANSSGQFPTGFPGRGWVPPAPINYMQHQNFPPGPPPPPNYSNNYSNYPNQQPMWNYTSPRRGTYHENRPQYQNNLNTSSKGNHFKQNNQKKEDNFIDFCEVCDRGFKTIEKKNEHYQEHTTCGVDECKFEAHFKIVDIHKRNFHGKFKNKLKFDTDEDIAKWREERRKNYPTAANIAKKLIAETERQKCGNVLNTKHFGKRNLHTKNTSSMQDDKDKVPKSPNTSTQHTNSNAFSLISANYLSSDDEPDNKEEGPPKKIMKKLNAKGKNKNRQKKTNLFTPIKTKQSLLEMLLATEIRKERNEILQCVRYVVKNNYLQ